MPQAAILFQADAAKTSTQSERRAWARHPTKVEGCCGRISDGMEPRLPARIQDVSSGGIALLVRRPFHPGTVLVLRLDGGKSNWSGVLFARVVHSRPQGPGEWVIGCAFASPLDEEELRAFLA
jgi:hypothetical protein